MALNKVHERRQLRVALPPGGRDYRALSGDIAPVVDANYRRGNDGMQRPGRVIANSER